MFILARYAAADRPCGRQAYPNSRPLSIRIGACTRCKFAFEHNSMYLLAEPSAFESALQMAAQWDISSVGTLVQYQVYWNKQHGPLRSCTHSGSLRIRCPPTTSRTLVPLRLSRVSFAPSLVVAQGRPVNASILFLRQLHSLILDGSYRGLSSRAFDHDEIVGHVLHFREFEAHSLCRQSSGLVPTLVCEAQLPYPCWWWRDPLLFDEEYLDNHIFGMAPWRGKIVHWTS